MAKSPVVYLMSNAKDGTIYTGVTSDLVKRVYQHKNHLVEGFTSKYNCTNLVYYEAYETMEQAILREKQIKAGSRRKKVALIESENREWLDLSDSISGY